METPSYVFFSSFLYWFLSSFLFFFSFPSSPFSFALCFGFHFIFVLGVLFSLRLFCFLCWILELKRILDFFSKVFFETSISLCVVFLGSRTLERFQTFSQKCEFLLNPRSHFIPFLGHWDSRWFLDFGILSQETKIWFGV